MRLSLLPPLAVAICADGDLRPSHGPHDRSSCVPGQMRRAAYPLVTFAGCQGSLVRRYERGHPARRGLTPSLPLDALKNVTAQRHRNRLVARSLVTRNHLFSRVTDNDLLSPRSVPIDCLPLVSDGASLGLGQPHGSYTGVPMSRRLAARASRSPLPRCRSFGSGPVALGTGRGLCRGMQEQQDAETKD